MNSAVSKSSTSLFVQAIIGGWCLLHLLTGAIAITPLGLPKFLEMIPPVFLLLIFLALILGMGLLFRYMPQIAPYVTLGILFFYGFLAGTIHRDTTLAAAFAGIFFAAFRLLFPKFSRNPLQSSGNASGNGYLPSTCNSEGRYQLFTCTTNSGTKYWFFTCALFFLIFTGGLTALRYLTFRTPCFDFGIFAQMFHQMKETGLPMTTCERNTLLSHFAVHLSPIYYLILPVYVIFPHPITLQIAQAAIIASGVIPLWKLCRHYKLGEWPCRFLAVVYFFHPALTGGCFYDIHENAFLAPLLLWLFYCSIFDKCRKYWIFIITLLILLVKEDAAIYPAFFGLWLICSGKDKKTGALLFGMSVCYFCGAIAFLNQYGLGAMVNRFDNLTNAAGGFGELLTSVFLLPSYALGECLDSEKITYLIQMLVPFALLPLCVRKASNWVLIGPLILMNLLSDYPYQHTIRFQYNFGSLSFLFLMALENLPRNRVKQLRLTLTAAAATLMLFGAAELSHLGVLGDYIHNHDRYQQMEETLDTIPQDASVSAATMLVAHLYDHYELYPLDAEQMTDYVVLDLTRPDGETEYTEEYYHTQGYRINYKDDYLCVLTHTDPYS